MPTGPIPPNIPDMLQALPDTTWSWRRVSGRRAYPLYPAHEVGVGTAGKLSCGTSHPDLNSGLRVFRKSLAEQFRYLPARRLLVYLDDHHVPAAERLSRALFPIDYHKRVGLSRYGRCMFTIFCLSSSDGHLFQPAALLSSLWGLVSSSSAWESWATISGGGSSRPTAECC